jgi:outer membrane protein assembly factor BamB
MFRVAFVALFALAAHARADWPQWRGPNRDGVATGAPKEWPKELRRAWRVEVGEGHAGPVAVGDRAFVLARVGDDEVLRCLELATGKEVWAQKLKTDAQLDGAVGWHGKTPKSTPCVADGRVYALSINGVVSCHSASDGKLLWRKSFEKQFPKTWPLYGSATSPVVYDGLVAVWVGGHDKGALVAWDAQTGDEKWALPADGPGYTSPVLVELAGTKQLVTQSQKLLLGVDPKTGKELWRQKFTTGYDQNSVTPVVANGLLIYSGYERSLFAAKLTKSGAAFKLEEAWDVREHPFYMSSPVVAGKRVVGLSSAGGGTLVAVNADDGTIAWKKAGVSKEYAALVRAGDTVLVQTTDGKVIAFDPAAAEFKALAEHSVADAPLWAHPALAGGVLLVKDKTHLSAWRAK